MWPTYSPIFLSPTFSFQNNTMSAIISWTGLPVDVSSIWNGFALLVNDVLRYKGMANNFMLDSSVWNGTVDLYFRIAFTIESAPTTFSPPYTLLADGSWLGPAW